MSVPATQTLVTVAFGDAEDQLWSTVFGGEKTVGVIDGAVVDLAASVGGRGAGAWEFHGEGVQLRVEADGEPGGSIGDPDSAAAVLLQPCRVSGTITRDGTAAAVDCPGVRARRTGPELAKLDSLRQVLAWFGSGNAIALDSSRPTKRRGHDHDEVCATVFAAEGAAPVQDARLSTTYGADRQPSRMSLELWLATEGDDEEHPFPKRAAGETVGPPSAKALDGVTVEIHRLAAHYAGYEGAGSYILARAR